VSFDLNYRPSVWQAIGGSAKAQEVNQAIAPHIDVMVGNEDDFTASVGFEVEGVDEHLSARGRRLLRNDREGRGTVPQLQGHRHDLRTVRTASVNDRGALAWSRQTGVVQATHRERLEIFDRVGGGDSFASGLIFGLLDGQPLTTAVEYGAAHCAWL
jgi:2-dehydro-3-deoxygluconokinase